MCVFFKGNGCVPFLADLRGIRETRSTLEAAIFSKIEIQVLNYAVNFRIFLDNLDFRTYDVEDAVFQEFVAYVAFLNDKGTVFTLDLDFSFLKPTSRMRFPASTITIAGKTVDGDL